MVAQNLIDENEETGGSSLDAAFKSFVYLRVCGTGFYRCRLQFALKFQGGWLFAANFLPIKYFALIIPSLLPH